MKRSIVCMALLSTLLPAAHAALPFTPTIEDQIRDLRLDMQLQESRREHDRQIDAIRAREEANRQQLQRNTDDAIMRYQMQQYEPQRRW